MVTSARRIGNIREKLILDDNSNRGRNLYPKPCDRGCACIGLDIRDLGRVNGSGYPEGLQGTDISLFGRMSGIADCFAAITKRRPYAEAISSYEAMRSLSGWSGDFFQEALVQQFISSVGVFPVGSLIELSTGEVAVVVEHSKVRRLRPRVLVVTSPDKTPAAYPTMVDLLYDPKMGGEEPAFIKRGLAPGAYGLNLADFYLA